MDQRPAISIMPQRCKYTVSHTVARNDSFPPQKHVCMRANRVSRDCGWNSLPVDRARPWSGREHRLLPPAEEEHSAFGTEEEEEEEEHSAFGTGPAKPVLTPSLSSLLLLLLYQIKALRCLFPAQTGGRLGLWKTRPLCTEFSSAVGEKPFVCKLTIS